MMALHGRNRGISEGLVKANRSWGGEVAGSTGRHNTYAALYECFRIELYRRNGNV